MTFALDRFAPDGRPMCYWPQGEGLTPITSDEQLRRAWEVPRHVGLTRIAWTGRRSVAVSTIHLIADHGHDWLAGPYRPLLWETIPFAETAHPDLDNVEDGECFGYQERYYSRAEAEAGHATYVRHAVAGLVGRGHTVVTRDLLAHQEPMNPTGRYGRDKARVRELRDLAQEYLGRAEGALTP